MCKLVTNSCLRDCPFPKISLRLIVVYAEETYHVSIRDESFFILVLPYIETFISQIL